VSTSRYLSGSPHPEIVSVDFKYHFYSESFLFVSTSRYLSGSPHPEIVSVDFKYHFYSESFLFVSTSRYLSGSPHPEIVVCGLSFWVCRNSTAHIEQQTANLFKGAQR
jgi:hypothetical protein